MIVKSEASCLLIVDVQDRLLPAMQSGEEVAENCAILMQAAARLSVPILISEQYPKGLGHTVESLATLAPAGSIVEKIHFSCASDEALANRIGELNRGQAVIAGIEAHVCVLQTTLQLMQQGTECFTVADATSSRKTASKETALARLRQDGAHIVTTEMVVFEWLGRAGTDDFRELSRLIR